MLTDKPRFCGGTALKTTKAKSSPDLTGWKRTDPANQVDLAYLWEKPVDRINLVFPRLVGGLLNLFIASLEP
jgi:hypothetical protein